MIGMCEGQTIFHVSLFGIKKSDIGPENRFFWRDIQQKSIGWLGPTPKLTQTPHDDPRDRSAMRREGDSPRVGSDIQKMIEMC